MSYKQTPYVIWWGEMIIYFIVLKKLQDVNKKYRSIII